MQEILSAKRLQGFQSFEYQSKIVDFSKFDPKISLLVVLLGFDDSENIKNSLQNIFNQFLSSKRFGIPQIISNNNLEAESDEEKLYINLSLHISVKTSTNKEFTNSYSQIVSNLQKNNETNDNSIHILRESEFTNIFSNLHAEEILNSKNTQKYTLFFVSYPQPLQFIYEDASEPANCLLFEFNSAFCNINSRPNINDTKFDQKSTTQQVISQIFESTSVFIDQILSPDLLDSTDLFMQGPNKIIAPVVTFGPKVQSLATLQKEINSLFYPIDSVIVVNRQDLYDFPLVSTLLQSKAGSIFSVLRHSEHIFGTSLDSEFISNTHSLNSSEKVTKICPIYVFNSIDSQSEKFPLYSKYDKNYNDNNYISVLFSNDDEAIEKMILSTVAIIAGNTMFFDDPIVSSFQATSRLTSFLLNFEYKMRRKNNIFVCVFGGHHPFTSQGGVKMFSSIIADVIIRNYALSNMLVAYKNYRKADDRMQNVKKLHLPFINATYKKSNLNTLQRMIIRTSERINKNEFAKALSSSTKAVEASFDILKETEDLLLEASIFGNCCPETIYVSRPINQYVVMGIIGSFLIALVYAFYKLCISMKKKRFTPVALL